MPKRYFWQALSYFEQTFPRVKEHGGMKYMKILFIQTEMVRMLAPLGFLPLLLIFFQQ